MLAPKGYADLEHRTGQERDEDLRDREIEVERHLAEHLQGDDHCGEVKPRVADRRQQHRVRPATYPQGRLAEAGFGGRAHRHSWYAGVPRVPERRRWSVSADDTPPRQAVSAECNLCAALP